MVLVADTLARDSEMRYDMRPLITELDSICQKYPVSVVNRQIARYRRLQKRKETLLQNVARVDSMIRYMQG